MPTLTTLLVNGNSVNGPRNWSSQDFATIDEAIASADGSSIGSTANATGDLDTSFLLSAVDSDFGSMSALSWRVRYRVAGAQTNTRSLAIRLVRESDGTVLAAATSGGAFATVASAITATTFQTSSVTAFAYVNTTAGKAAWDDARVEFRESTTRNKGGDTNGVQVDTVEITGTYVAGHDLVVADATHSHTADNVTLSTFGAFDPPTGLQATAVSASQIDLSWDEVSGATGYDIERDSAVIVADHQSTSYSDTGLAGATEYTYRVRARQTA